jgi:hypothetical protein
MTFYKIFIIINSIFYFGYAFLGLFLFDIWSENILFPYNYNKKCTIDNYVYHYLRISASIACLIMTAISALFLLNEMPKRIRRFFLRIQILIWFIWTIFEAYYLFYGIVVLWIGIVQTLLCIILVILALISIHEQKEENISFFTNIFSSY